MKVELSHLIEISRIAGRILKDGYGKEHTVEHKGKINIVTEVDKASEKTIIDYIQERFPDHTIIAEESGELNGTNHAWIIDPLDGTSNYAHGVPIFSVSIAYAVDGQLQMGVVYDPLRDELFSAERGKGAYLNETRIQVAEETELIKSLLVTGFPYDVQTAEHNNLDNYTYFALRSHAVRRLGSAALDLCYIASGRLDGYWELQLEIWDLAAGALIVQEAGGMATNRWGGDELLKAPYSIIAANENIHKFLLEGINRKD